MVYNTHMKATKSITDRRGITWTIENIPGEHFTDFHDGRSSVGHRTSFHTRSGALKWLKRMVAESDARATV